MTRCNCPQCHPVTGPCPQALDVERLTRAADDYARAIAQLTRKLSEARALLTAVGASGVSWSTPGYVVVQIDRATWAAITGAPTPVVAPGDHQSNELSGVGGFDFPLEVS